jgi:putative colanic acid biosynthesis glycosyltransferase WcaI
MRARFLFLNQFYPPDLAPTGRILHDLATRLVQRGHTVCVICSRKAYATGTDLGPGGVLEGVDVERVRATPINMGSLIARGVEDAAFLLQAATAAIFHRPRPDLVLAASSPPFIGVVGALVGRSRGIPHTQWTMDLYPEVLQAHWGLGQDSLAARALELIARFQFSRAALVLTLGPHMARRVARHLNGRSCLYTVPLWSELAIQPADGAVSDAWRTRRGWERADLVLLYSGNMGRGHRFGEFLEAARRLGPAGPVWAFVGGGPRRPEVESFRHEHPGARVELLPYVPAADVNASLRSADVHLISLSAAWEGVIVPSKLQAAFSVGRPVIFVGPAENETAASIRESGGGWIVSEGDIDGLISAVEEARAPAVRAQRGRAAFEYARIHFDRDHNCQQIADLLEQSVIETA